MLKVEFRIKIKPEYNPKNLQFRVGEEPGVLFVEECNYENLTKDYVLSNKDLKNNILDDNDYLFKKYLQIESKIISDN